MSSTLFTGSSRYSSDFQAMIERAVAIASLPLTQMNQVKQTIADESTALGALDTKFAALQSAIAGVQNATGSSSLAASVSDTNKLRATVATGAFEGSYKFRVVSLGAHTQVMSSNGLTTVTDPASQNIASAVSYNLNVNGVSHAIQPKGTSLNDLVAAINADPDANVQATIVNVASNPADYRLSLQSKTLDAISIQLTATHSDQTTTDLLDTADTPGTSLVTGSKAIYRVGTSTTDVSTDSRSVTLSPGLTIEMLETSATAIDISVTRSSASLSNALDTLASSYNAAMAELDKSRGSGGGKLAGNSLVSSLAGIMRNTVNYSSGSGTIASLTDLGLVFDKEGKLSLDSEVFSKATSGGLTAAYEFLGASDTGGFLKAATDALNGVEDSTKGILKNAITANSAQSAAQDKLIAEQQDRIDQLEASLQAQMAAADALIASLEQQASYFINMFEAMASANQNR